MEDDLGTDGTFTSVDMDFTITAEPPSEPPENVTVVDLHGTDHGPTNQCANITAAMQGHTPPGFQLTGSAIQAQALDPAQTAPYTYDAHIALQNLIDRGYAVTLGQIAFAINFYGYGFADFQTADLQAVFQSPEWQNRLRASDQVARSGFATTDILGFAKRFGL